MYQYTVGKHIADWYQYLLISNIEPDFWISKKSIDKYPELYFWISENRIMDI